MDTLRLPVLLCALLGSYRVEARGGDGAIVGHHHGNSLLHHQPQDQPQPQRQHQQKQKHQPDGDNPGEDAVAAFLHTGDARTLAHANCSHRFELASSRGSTESMSRVLDTIIHATNFLNMILQNNRSREQSLRSDIEWYQALVRSIIEGDERIHRAVLSFSVDSVKPDVLLQATRSGGHTLLQDLSEDHLHQRSPESEWYHGLKRRKKPLFHKSVLSQDFSVEQRESFIPDRSHVLWSSPYLECERGKLLPRWLLTLSAAFYGKRDQAPEFRYEVYELPPLVNLSKLPPLVSLYKLPPLVGLYELPPLVGLSKLPPLVSLYKLPPLVGLYELPPLVGLSKLPPLVSLYKLPPLVGLYELPPLVGLYELPPLVSLYKLPPLVGLYELPPLVGLSELPPLVSLYKLPPLVGLSKLPPLVSLYKLPPLVSLYKLPPLVGLSKLPPLVSLYKLPPLVGLYELPPLVGLSKLPPLVGLSELPPLVSLYKLPPLVGLYELPPLVGLYELPPLVSLYKL
ncbi:unnamed protein product [Knipowitschia caucasica]